MTSLSGAKPPLRLLIVDDVCDNVVSLKTLLDALQPGCQVVTAFNGLSALRLAGTFRPHLGHHGPADAGHERPGAVRLIREQAWGRSMVLVAASGQAPELVRPTAREAGFDEHVLKPLDVSWLRQRLREWYQRTEAARSAE